MFFYQIQFRKFRNSLIQLYFENLSHQYFKIEAQFILLFYSNFIDFKFISDI